MTCGATTPAVLQARDQARDYAERNDHIICGFIHDGDADHPARHIVAGCTRCGMRVIVHVMEEPLIEGAATIRVCDSNPLRKMETHAWLLSQSPTLLEPRLQQGIEDLPLAQQERFDPGVFQFHRQRWVSDDGTLALQWKLRDEPQHTISVENRQGLWGVVEMLNLVIEDGLLPAHYVGPRINPNSSENEEEWLWYPLAPGESGFTYRDDEDNWRFKREDGFTGFFVRWQDIVFRRFWLDVEPKPADSPIEANAPSRYP